MRCSFCSCVLFEKPSYWIYTLSLHDALPISRRRVGRYCPSGDAHPAEDGSYRPPGCAQPGNGSTRSASLSMGVLVPRKVRSEEHTSELQSLRHLVCRLLLEKKNNDKQPLTKT